MVADTLSDAYGPVVPELQATLVVRATRGVDQHPDGPGHGCSGTYSSRCMVRQQSPPTFARQCARRDPSTVRSQQASLVASDPMSDAPPLTCTDVHHGNVCGIVHRLNGANQVETSFPYRSQPLQGLCRACTF